MATHSEDHWRKAYADKQPDEVSCCIRPPLPLRSTLCRLGAGPEQSLIDIGGGASTLVDALLARAVGPV